MFVLLGNSSPKDKGGAPADLNCHAVTQVNIPDHYTVDANVETDALKQHVLESAVTNDGITHSPDNEALLALVHPSGIWANHSFTPPTWVQCDNADFANAVSKYYGGIPTEAPADVENTHYTLSGPPGTGPSLISDTVANVKSIQALLVNSGRDIWARAEGGGQVGYTGTATATSSTTLTATGTPWTSNQWLGSTVVAGAVFGQVVSNTSSALTIDRWYNFATPGGAAGTTPSGTTVFAILSGNAPAWFVGLSTSNTSPNATDTSLGSEIVNGTPSGENNAIGTLPTGLLRQIAPYAHTAGTNTFTLTPVYTVNSNESGILPVTIYKIGVFGSIISTNTASTLMFETLLSASATLSAVGDQLTVTETVTGS